MGQCGEQAGKFTCCAVGKRHLAGFPHLGVVDRWPASPKRARIAHWSDSRDRRINMQLNTKIQNTVFSPNSEKAKSLISSRISKKVVRVLNLSQTKNFLSIVQAQ